MNINEELQRLREDNELLHDAIHRLVHDTTAKLAAKDATIKELQDG